jgi:DNA recombination protein RmuC
LAGALRSSGVRGTWGEVQLRRVVEHAGMLENVDFDVQVPGVNDQGAGVRPDAIVRLPGGRHVVIDAKVPMSALLSESESGEQTAATPLTHAKALRSHCDSLSNKRYWTAFTPTPELVICFLPSEGLLATACRADPTLLDDALALRVVIATPTTLLAMLRTVALTWQQESLVGNAREVVDAAKELHERVIGLGGVLAKLGRSLTRAVDDYNSVVNAVDRRVLVGAQALADLGRATTPLPCVPTITPRARVPAGHPPEAGPVGRDLVGCGPAGSGQAGSGSGSSSSPNSSSGPAPPVTSETAPP